MILVNTFDVSSLMLVKKRCWAILYVCSITTALEDLGKMLTTNSTDRADLYHFSWSRNKKKWFVLKTRKSQIFFVVLCSKVRCIIILLKYIILLKLPYVQYPYRLWDLNNVRARLFTKRLWQSHRSLNFLKDLSFLDKRKSEVDS